ncbi:MAG: hypothetical protein IKJ69_01745 [Clostridia bacterium]|nr:hypothetical protein [Clostridia bacterium]
MDIKKLINKTKYSLFAFILLAMPSLIFDGFKSIPVLACRLLLCVGVALFLSLHIGKESSVKAAVLPTFLMLGLMSCNVIFLTDDVHILLSLLSFFLALFFSEKLMWLTPVFAGLCVAAQPLTILLLVPAIIVIQLIKKQNIPAVVSVGVSIAAFVLTKLLADNAEFYAEQGEAYYLWLHPVFFTVTHTEYLLNYLLFSLPLIAVLLCYAVSLILKKNIFAGVSLPVITILSVYGFSLSKNVHTVFMILIPAFAVLLSFNGIDTLKKATDKVSDFFASHLFVFLLTVALIASMPMIVGNLPFGSDFFDTSTFIIFREE